MSKTVILTGIRSNGELTLGNYLGAILPLIQLQTEHAADYQINMFVPDLHSFTTPIVHEDLYANTIRNLKMFIASGLNIENKNTYIYRQSFIPAHAELTWILDCFIYYGELNRMIQFKEKNTAKEPVSVGLYNYPALMAADILLYDAKYVPVGDDQKQHLELARTIAMRMNHQFNKDLFTIPESWEKQLQFSKSAQGVRIRSLKHPERKMSKSIVDPAGTILLTDEPANAANKINSAITDSIGIIHYDFVNQPGISNILQIISLLSKRSLKDTLNEWEGRTSYGELKLAASTLVSNFLTELQANVSRVAEPDLLKSLESDEAAMNIVANTKLDTIKLAVGLRKN